MSAILNRDRPLEMVRIGILEFYARPGSSDMKAIKEVIAERAYLRKDFRIEGGEHWWDLGGNVGAFAVGAAFAGAFVSVVEPDPANVALIRANLKLNGLKADIRQAVVVHDNRDMATLNLWPNGQSWRNSIVRNRKGTVPIKVKAENFFELVKPDDCVKMDIEGAEIDILEAWPDNFRCKKLVFEYSFDVDASCERLRGILARLGRVFGVVSYSKQIDKLDRWTFFPPATMVFCYGEKQGSGSRYLTGA